MADQEENRPPSGSLPVAGPPFASLMEGDPSQKPSKCQDVSFMIYRRFGHVYLQELRQGKHKVDEQHKPPKKLPRDEHDSNSQLSSRSRLIASCLIVNGKSRIRFLTKIEEKLNRFNSLLLKSEALKRAPAPNTHRYQSIREYLCHGPPIYMNYYEIQDSRWSDYEAVVKKILQDPETARWLDGPLNPDWDKSPQEQLRGEHGEQGADDTDTTSLFKAKRKLHGLVPGIILLFWILHITAALAYPLIARNPTLGSSEPGVNSLAISLLAYWYLSALGIIVQGLLAKGFIYARKVFLGGLLTCFGGFYVLYMLMDISAASSSAAIPSLFTTVLLLIRTM